MNEGNLRRVLCRGLLLSVLVCILVICSSAAGKSQDPVTPNPSRGDQALVSAPFDISSVIRQVHFASLIPAEWD